jgi:hypothetical protein
MNAHLWYSSHVIPEYLDSIYNISVYHESTMKHIGMKAFLRGTGCFARLTKITLQMFFQGSIIQV